MLRGRNPSFADKILFVKSCPQAALRHSKLDLTMNVYTDPSPVGRSRGDESLAFAPSG